MIDDLVILWRDELLIGEATIDAQHRRLVELIAGVSDRPQDDDSALIDEALAYATTHFVDEEALMRRVGFPDLARHQGEHKVLTRTLLAYKQRFDDGHTDLYSLKHFMFRWVRDHIVNEDQAIGRFLARKTQ